MIKLRVHPLFYLLLFIAGLAGDILSVSLVFISVLIHEVAHMLTAFGFGYQTAVIELFPFGGVAKLDYALFNDPIVEGITALAGPVQSLILALLSCFFDQLLGVSGNALTREMYNINLGLAFFNLLPIFPLDGGRILRAVVRAGLGMNYQQASKTVIRLTKFLTITALPFSVYYSLMRKGSFHVPLILIFLFIAAKEENFFYAYWRQKQSKEAKFTKTGVLPAKMWMVKGERRIHEILPFLGGKSYHLFFVLDKNGKIIELLKEQDLLSSFSEDPHATFLSKVRHAGRLDS